MSYDEFITSVGAMAMGATTYEWILDHEFAGRTRRLEVAVRHPLLGLHPSRAGGRAQCARRIHGQDVATVHEEMLAAAGTRNVWIVGGGDLAGQFADAGLLDEILVLIAPVALGGGAPLPPRRLEFAPGRRRPKRRLRLRHVFGRARACLTVFSVVRRSDVHLGRRRI